MAKKKKKIQVYFHSGINAHRTPRKIEHDLSDDRCPHCDSYSEKALCPVQVGGGVGGCALRCCSC